MRNKKAFTLIELVSVLVILAILALIVTPLVLNIIRKARIAADKRSIDAYGRSIELAVADYLLENGTFPTSIEELTIEYSGDRVECETAGLQLDDTSVYLAECTVNGRDVPGYTYGRIGAPIETYRAYSIGDIIEYNNINYYVIKDSDETESSVTLLKAEPLTTSEVNTYGTGHVNMYATSNTNSSYYKQAYDNNGYGGVQYYSSASCTNYGDTSGCTNVYENSEIKNVVDAWALDKIPSGLEEARLITLDELINNLGYTLGDIDPSTQGYVRAESTPEWIHNSSYYYWTMSQYNDSVSNVWSVYAGGYIYSANVDDYHYNVIRPVIVLSKSSLN